ncbi:phosphoribosyltransferase domain-containing protein [Nocardioides sp. TF02-7]|uniref:phosphoribosyltransferase domain-containing protein n=1 Tax=Nocardioides sp. TF02-7 TaxID=2917724 RepID=UPI0023DB3D4C|nr:phosphoribosyltransferase domain-containing protein [Nocardioides sp. TF02-7]
MRARFDEEHSHAVAHLVQPTADFLLDGSGALVLVDDELTSGRTVLNTVAALHALHQRPEYVVAALLDARTPAAREEFDKRVADLGVRVSVVSLLSAHLTLPEDVLDRAARARAQLPAPAPVPSGPEAQVHVHGGWWPGDVPVTARHGMTTADTRRLADASVEVARRLAGVIGPRRRQRPRRRHRGAAPPAHPGGRGARRRASRGLGRHPVHDPLAGARRRRPRVRRAPHGVVPGARRAGPRVPAAQRGGPARDRRRRLVRPPARPRGRGGRRPRRRLRGPRRRAPAVRRPRPPGPGQRARPRPGTAPGGRRGVRLLPARRRQLAAHRPLLDPARARHRGP